MQNISEVRSKIHQHGRINIPASLRHQLHLEIGDDIIFQVQGENLLITTPERALMKFQQLLKSHQIDQDNPDKISLVDELIAMRRQAADNE